MDKDRIKGSVKQADGKARETLGKLTGDQALQADGKLKSAEGAVQKAFGKLKDIFRKP
jgi:uncharacterized protein YjbJ (UPF0337 family)